MHRRNPYAGGGVVFMVLALYAAGAAAAPVFVEVGRIPLTLEEPAALAIANGKLYAGGNGAIAVMDMAAKQTNCFAFEGHPGCMAALPDGRLLVGLKRRVIVLDVAGSVTATWPDLGERAWLTSIAVDAAPDADASAAAVFVADAGNRVVYRYDMQGVLQGRIGEADKQRDIPGLVVPSAYLDVALDPMGSLWVVNPGKCGLENYRRNGELVSSWYRPGMAADSFCGCCNPAHIAFREDSTLVTIEKGLGRIKLYAPDTSLLAVVATLPPGSETTPHTVESPISDVAVDDDNRILVLNRPDSCIIIYDEKKPIEEKKAP